MTRTRKEQKETLSHLHVPLAARMRPRTLDDFVGHATVVGAGTALRGTIERGKAGSLILWGPPGVGKTTLAEIIARQIHPVRDPDLKGLAGVQGHLISNGVDAAELDYVERISAVTAGVRDLKVILERAKQRRRIGKPTVLIVDEIHRFNKAQQDVLLPAVEEGVVTMIGATTENPYFEVISALVSRAEVVRLEQLGPDDIRVIVRRAITQEHVRLKFGKGAEDALVQFAAGDARRALNILERASAVAAAGVIKLAQVESAAQQVVVQYDKAGDAHYDTISAFIKSLRGSDPDATLFYLFRMLVAGEDERFIMRRMFIFASEDIGNADPHALMLVAAASQALEWVGLPEAEFFLAHTAVYLAAAPKSNSVTVAMSRARADVEKHGNAPPPGHITNAPIEGMKKHGKGVGYKYPHDFPGHVVKQQYRPDVVQGHVYYEPGSEGFEKEVKRRVEAARKILGFTQDFRV